MKDKKKVKVIFPGGVAPSKRLTSGILEGKGIVIMVINRKAGKPRERPREFCKS